MKSKLLNTASKASSASLLLPCPAASSAILFQSFESAYGASVVAQWMGIHLPMQGTQVRALVWEDPTFHGATEPKCHNY